jgi:hypothetical protein
MSARAGPPFAGLMLNTQQSLVNMTQASQHTQMNSITCYGAFLHVCERWAALFPGLELHTHIISTVVTCHMQMHSLTCYGAFLHVCKRWAAAVSRVDGCINLDA